MNMSRNMGLTDVIEQEVKEEWVKEINERQKDIPKTSKEIIKYLRDQESQNTSDYVLRRHIQKEYPSLIKEAEKKTGCKCANLVQNKNVTWDSEP